MAESTEFKNDDLAEMKYIIGQYEKLNAIGVALSSEHDTITLLEKILMGAISLTPCGRWNFIYGPQ